MLAHVRTLWKLLGLALLACACARAQIDGEAAGAPPGRTGVIVGRIFDQASGLTLGDVNVSVVGTDLTTRTDFQGRFRIPGVPVGTYSVTLSREGYQPATVTDVVVRVGEPGSVEVALREVAPGATSGDAPGEEIIRLDEFVISARVLATSGAAMTAMRRVSPVAVDAISADDLKRFVASDVSDAMLRLPGVSVSTRGSFAVIRGLSERYNVTTLNGLQLPSSDPERQSVELDQFPTRLLDSLVVYKAFAANLPSNLTGGGVDIRTTAFPDAASTSVTVGLGIDEGALTDGRFLTYRTFGLADRLGFGSNDRVAAADIVEAGGSARVTPPDPLVPFTAEEKSVPVGPRFALFHADTHDFDGGASMGYTLSFTYESSYGSEEGRVNDGRVFNQDFDADGRIRAIFSDIPRTQHNYLRSEEKVLLGVLGTVTYKFSPEHDVNLTAFVTQTGIDRAQYNYDYIDVFNLPYTPEALDLGFVTSTGETAEKFRYLLRYRERQLASYSLNGRHIFVPLNEGRLKWAAAWNTTYQDEPDNRRYTFVRPFAEAQFEVRAGTDVEGAISRAWRRVDEEQFIYELEYTQPFDVGRFKNVSLAVGALWSPTTRRYSELFGTSAGSGLTSPTVLERPQDVSHYAVTTLLLDSLVSLERTLGALYANLSLPITDSLKLTAGVRADHTQIQSEGFGIVPGSSNLPSVLHYTNGTNIARFFPDVPWDRTDAAGLVNQQLAKTDIDEVTLLPAFGLSWSPFKDFTLRASYSQTLARPSLRELGNYYSVDEEDTLQHGNAFLKLSDVRNIDLRAEYFMQGTDIVALSLFYKEVDRPIERFGGLAFPTASGASVVSWFNNPNTAYIQGAELEFRKSLGFLDEVLSGWSIGGNFSYIDARVRPRVTTNSEGTIILTVEKDFPAAYPETRRLADQPRWLMNCDLTYQSDALGFGATLAYLASDDVLSSVEQQFDQYRKGTGRLDLTVTQRLTERMRLRLTARNLTDPEQKLIRDPEQTGGVEITDRRWTDGRSYSISVAYDF